jgi:hypothetical protein
MTDKTKEIEKLKRHFNGLLVLRGGRGRVLTSRAELKPLLQNSGRFSFQITSFASSVMLTEK